MAAPDRLAIRDRRSHCFSAGRAGGGALFAPLEPAVQGAIVGGFFALIASQVALFVQRRLREQGEVICQLSAWNDGGDARPGEYRIFEARFYNKKDVNIAL